MHLCTSFLYEIYIVTKIKFISYFVGHWTSSLLSYVINPCSIRTSFSGYTLLKKPCSNTVIFLERNIVFVGLYVQHMLCERNATYAIKRLIIIIIVIGYHERGMGGSAVFPSSSSTVSSLARNNLCIAIDNSLAWLLIKKIIKFF